MGADLPARLRTRASIRRQIATRKSVQEGKPDRIADLLDEAADRIDLLDQALRNENSLRLGYHYRNGLPIESIAEKVLYDS